MKTIEMRKIGDTFLLLRLDDGVMQHWWIGASGPLLEPVKPLVHEALTVLRPYAYGQGRALDLDRPFAGAPVSAERGDLIAVYALDESTLPTPGTPYQDIAYRRVA